MLYKVTIENFFSIADRQEISFEVPGNAPDLPCFKASRSNAAIRLPVSIGFFGPNASGKSTILRAVTSAAAFAIHSFDWVDQMKYFFQAYRQENWWGKPTQITIEFDGQLSDHDPSAIFRYDLQISHQPKDLLNKVVLYEALFYAPKGKFRRLFERQNQQFYFGQEFGIASANDPRIQSVRPDAGVISTFAKFNHPIAGYLSALIGKLHTNILSFYKLQQNANQFLSIYLNDKNCLARLNKTLRRLDIGLESMIIEPGANGPLAKFTHTGLNEFIFFDEESAGTKRFIEIFPRIHFALETGGVVVIDEIDTDLHPLLLPELFRWFSDLKHNPHGAQLIFTAHNPAILDDLEKEQIFFVEKPSGQSTQVYGARDIKGLRREPSLMRKYIAGELGAVPHIG